MAGQNGDGSRSKISPGDAAFRRLQAREALTARGDGPAGPAAGDFASASGEPEPSDQEPEPPSMALVPSAEDDFRPPASRAEEKPDPVKALLARANRRSSKADFAATRLIEQLKAIEAGPIGVADGFDAERSGGVRRRSPYAPDPIRQRNYFDDASPIGLPESSFARGAARRMELPGGLAEPRAARASFREARWRVPDLAAMSIAAVLGLGAGLAGYAVFGLFVTPRPVSVAAAPPSAFPAAPDESDTAPAAGGSTVVAMVPETADEALSTLLSHRVTAPDRFAGKLGTAPAAPAMPAGALAPAANPAAKTAPGTIAATGRTHPTPQPASTRTANAHPTGGVTVRPGGPLAYAPVIPPYDPVGHSLLGKPGPETGPAAEAEVPQNGPATINISVNMRAKPDNDAAVVSILAEGTDVRVLSCDFWCEVEADGKRGYVFRKFVTQ
jgi:Bacterial SH3 domain